jgi:TRAP-type uncharacterized transport system fused permease subunit
MAAGVVLGMGLPTTPAYIIMAALIIPALVKMNVTIIAAHMFVFYFAIISAITPPVALASYAAAGIARSDPMKTGWCAMRLGIVAYIVPFMFVYSPSLLFVGSLPWIIWSTMTAAVGVIALAASIQGWMYRKVGSIGRIALLVSAICLIKPGIYTDIVGLLLLIPIYIDQRWERMEILNLAKITQKIKRYFVGGG